MSSSDPKHLIVRYQGWGDQMYWMVPELSQGSCDMCTLRPKGGVVHCKAVPIVKCSRIENKEKRGLIAVRPDEFDAYVVERTTRRLIDE